MHFFRDVPDIREPDIRYRISAIRVNPVSGTRYNLISGTSLLRWKPMISFLASAARAQSASNISLQQECDIVSERRVQNNRHTEEISHRKKGLNSWDTTQAFHLVRQWSVYSVLVVKSWHQDVANCLMSTLKSLKCYCCYELTKTYVNNIGTISLAVN